MATGEFAVDCKIEIGSSPITLENEDFTTLQCVNTVNDECGTFTLTIVNTDGKYKTSFSLYDEVKIYFKYSTVASYTQVFGGHLDKIGVSLSEVGELLIFTGRSYEQQFLFKQIYHTWMFEHWSDILVDIVDYVNGNVADNFTTNFLANVEQTTDDTDTGDIDDPVGSTETMGQSFKPNESYLATVVVKGYKTNSPVDNLECRLYKAKDLNGDDTDNVNSLNWVQTIAGSLLGSAIVGPEYITDDSDNPQEISFQMDVPNLTVDGLYLLVFALEEETADGEYYLRYNSSSSYADGEYYENQAKQAGTDLWFKINALCAKFEDKDAFACMRDIAGRVMRDWYSDTSKQVEAIARYSASVATFTVGVDVISCNIDRDVTPLVNRIIAAGEPKVVYKPSDKDLWTEDNAYGALWEVDFDEGANGGPNTVVAPYGSADCPIGGASIAMGRTSTGNNTTARIEFPSDETKFTSAEGLDNRVKAVAFWVAGQSSAASDARLRFCLIIYPNSGQEIYKDVYLNCSSTGTALDDEWQFITVYLPSAGSRRKWMDDSSDQGHALIEWSDAEQWSDSPTHFIEQVGIWLYADNDGVTDGTIEYLQINGLHFILEDDNRITINETTSQGNFDIRDYVIRDKALDNLQTVQQKAQFIRRLRGDASTSWSGTPGDTKDVQIVGKIKVSGRTDIIPGNTITIVYANGNISMAFRVHSVSHVINKSMGWTTEYELAMLLPQLTISRAIANYMRLSDQLEQRKAYAASGKMIMNISSHTEDKEW